MLSISEKGRGMSSRQNAEVFTEVVLEIFKAGGLLNAAGDELTKEFGLTSSRWKILGAVKIAETPLTVSQIARFMGQTRQAVQRLADVMTKDGLLQQTDNPNHKRAKLIEITLVGQEVYEQLDRKQNVWADQCSAELTGAELETTLNVLRAISKQMEG